MAFFDMPLDALRSYRPVVASPPDFDTFWKSTLESARSYNLDVRFEPIDYGLTLVDTYDVTYAGYGGQPIKAWLVLPRQRTGKLPCVVEYIGYGGGRGFAFDSLLWANCGYAHLLMDTRGQGSSWRQGDTPDIPVDGGNPFFPGFMTQGILNPETYYYRRVFTDAVRAVEAARSHSEVDASRVVVTGGSQGGGISIAVGGLQPDVQAVIPDVPFLCHFRRAVTIEDTAPYSEIANYLRTHREKIETVFTTLSYFDGVNFAARTSAQCLYSVALMDKICPPSTVFAAYNAVDAPKDIKIYDFNGHEGGASYHTLEKMKFLSSLWS